MDRVVAARWAMLGAALAFSTGGAGIKSCGFGAFQVAGLRSLVAAVVLLLAVPACRRGWNRRVVLVSLAYALMMILFVTANKLTTAANAIFLQSTFPLYVVVLGPFVLGERFRRAELGVLAVMGVGTAMFAFAQDDPTAIATDPVRGNVVAAAAGAMWGLTVLGLRWLARDEAGVGAAASAAVLGNLIAAAIALTMAWPLETGTPADWGVAVYLGAVQVGLAYFLMTRAMQHLDALEASVLLMSEPAMSPVWAWLVHGEVPSGLAMLGGGLILLGLGMRTLLSRPATVSSA